MSLGPRSAETLGRTLIARLSTPRRRRCGAYRFRSDFNYGRDRGPAPATARRAAVCLLLYPRPAGWSIPFILRSPNLPDHAGQISLPGGAVEPGESPSQCALREMEEEIGVPVQQAQRLGTLPPIYIYRSDFLVQPLVAISRTRPAFRPNPAEVDQLLEIPVACLRDGRSYGMLQVARPPLNYQAACLWFQGHRIWGATARIVGDFLEQAADLFP